MSTRCVPIRSSIAGWTLAVLAGLMGGCASADRWHTDDSTVSAIKPEAPVSDESEASGEQYAGQQTAGFDEVESPGVAVAPVEAFPDEEEPLVDRVVDSLRPKKLWNDAKDAVGLGPDENLAKQHFAEAEELYREGEYDEAASKYGDAAFRWPDSVLEEDSLFKQGECLFFADEYYASSDVFTNLMKKYENSRYLEYVMQRRFAMGRYWEKIADERSFPRVNVTDEKFPYIDLRGNAIALYESIRLEDPTGPLADDAIMATANCYFLRELYEDAAYHYDLLRKEHPHSEFQAQAHLLGMRAKLLAYQGPDYQGKPLEEAEELAETLLTQFSNDLPVERETIVKAQAEIRAQLAERDWNRAEYYYNSSQYRAAGFYYEAVAQKYGDTRFGELAQARLEEIKDKPPIPVNRFGWLIEPIYGKPE